MKDGSEAALIDRSSSGFDAGTDTVPPRINTRESVHSRNNWPEKKTIRPKAAALTHRAPLCGSRPVAAPTATGSVGNSGGIA